MRGGVTLYQGPVNLWNSAARVSRFQVVEGPASRNFHLPRSSLLLLVSALLGRHDLLDLLCRSDHGRARLLFLWRCGMWIAPKPPCGRRQDLAAAASEERAPQRIKKKAPRRSGGSKQG